VHFRGESVLIAGRVVTPERLVAFHARMRVAERPVRAGTLLARLALAGASVAVAI
jgi:hypothetical protein